VIKDELEKLLNNAVQESLQISRTITLDHPQELAHGDFATSIALAASKDLGKNPKEIAESIAKVIENINDPRIKDVSVAGPGFINISLSEKALYDELVTIEKKGNEFGNNESLKNKKVLVEHSSPNLFKPFHIGHLMNNTIGESMVRIMKSTGANVTTLSFPSDVSLGIAKAVYIMLEDGISIFDTKQTDQEKNCVHRRVLCSWYKSF
jgi:arginyl-tRNA synthetase